MINEAAIVKYISETFSEVESQTDFGYTFFFHGSDHRVPFASLASCDNEHDRVSQLGRPGVFRLSIGINKKTFQSLFGTGTIDPGSYDFTALDVIMPHPHYAAQSFVCVLNPGEANFGQVRELLAEAYALAAARKGKLKEK